MGTDVNVHPGHGKAGRQPTRQFLDTLSGHEDPGMFGRMFPTLELLAVDDGPLRELADAMKDPNPGDAAETISTCRRASPISASSSITTSRSI
ncbi:hypothetical protein [Bradyrhizobium sp. RDT46]|uniref:hypothetical protein n=1 Tax=Bradyrhizobium sp. RDT46 TaxID=3341829 RepID=UPI0035C6EE47